MPARNSGEGLDIPLTRANIEARSAIEELYSRLPEMPAAAKDDEVAPRS